MKSRRFRRVHKNTKVRKSMRRKSIRRKSMRRKTMRRRRTRRRRTRRRRGGMDPAASSGAHPAEDRDGSKIDEIASQTKMSPEQRKEAIKKKIPKEEADEAKNSTAAAAAKLASRDTRLGPIGFSVTKEEDFPSL